MYRGEKGRGGGGGRAIDFTSNRPNMTTMTCQRNRIVSPAGIVSIRRYILLRSGDFFSPEDGRKTHGVWKRPGQHHARPNRRRTKETAQDKLPGASATTALKARYWFSVIFSGLRHLTAFRHYQEPISMSRLFIPDGRGGEGGGPPCTRRVFVCRGGRRADAAWISRKSGGVSYSVKFTSHL